MAKKAAPTPEQLLQLSLQLELDPEKATEDALLALREQLQGGQKAFSKLFKETKEPGSLFRLRALFYLAAEQIKHIERHPKRTWNLLLHKASEWTGLKISVNEEYSQETRDKFTPIPERSGISSSHFLLSAKASEIAEAKSEEDLLALDVRKTAIYKPMEQSAGGRDAPIRYQASREKLKEILKEDPERELPPRRTELMETENGWRLFGIDSNGMLSEEPCFERSIDPNEPERSFEEEGIPYYRTGSPYYTVRPGKEMLNEALFYTLSLYLEDKARALPTPPIRQFWVPATTVEAFPHPNFGPHHKVGSRQQYISGALSPHKYRAYKHSEQKKEGKQSGPGRLLSTIPDAEVFKIALLDFLTGNMDRHLSNLLIRDDIIFHIDAGYAFPSYGGTKVMMRETVKQGWRSFKQAYQPFSKPWVKLIESLDSDAIIERMQEEVEWINRRFPKIPARLRSSQQLVIHGSVRFLQEAVRQEMTLRDMTTMFMSAKVKDEEGEEIKTEDDKSVYVGFEFWHVLDISCLSHGFNYNDQHDEIPREVKSSLAENMKSLFEHYYVIRNMSPAMIGERKVWDPHYFVRWAIEGKYDQYFVD